MISIWRIPGSTPLAAGIVITYLGATVYLKALMPEVISGLLIGVGVTLISTGLNELSKFYSSTTMLEKPIL